MQIPLQITIRYFERRLVGVAIIIVGVGMFGVLASYLAKSFLSPTKRESEDKDLLEKQNLAEAIRRETDELRQEIASMRDELYVPRSDDRVVKNLAEHPGETLIIKAPRQFGKTSLLMRYLTWCHSLGKQVALIDFSILSSRDLADYSTFLATVASALLRALNIPQQTPLQFDVQAHLTWFIEDKILKYITLPIVFAIDQADRILGQPFQEDFFSMLRMWHNLRAHPHNLLWQGTDLVIVISTETYLLMLFI